MSNRAPRARFCLASVGINMLIEAEARKFVCTPQRRDVRRSYMAIPFVRAGWEVEV